MSFVTSFLLVVSSLLAISVVVMAYYLQRSKHALQKYYFIHEIMAANTAMLPDLFERLTKLANRFFQYAEVNQSLNDLLNEFKGRNKAAIDHVLKQNGVGKTYKTVSARLTDKELLIVCLRGWGFSSAQVATILGTTRANIRATTSRIHHKVGNEFFFKEK